MATIRQRSSTTPQRITFPGKLNLSAYVSGTGQTVDAAKEGYFSPNHWRFNKSTMIKGSCRCQHEAVSFANGITSGPIMGYIVDSTMNTYWWYNNRQGLPPDWLIKAARIKAANRRFDQQFAGSVFLAEFRQTIDMITNPIKGLVKLAKKGLALKKRGRSRKSNAKRLAGYWLEARYGWIPLAHDVKDLTNMLLLGIQGASQSQFYTTHGTERYETTSTTDTSYFKTECRAWVRSTDVIQYSARSTHGWSYVVGHETDHLWSQLGLHYYDIPSLIWEKVPFSFAVDWLFKVGDFLQYLRPTPWLAKLGEGYAVKTHFKRTMHAQRYQTPGRMNSWVDNGRLPSHPIVFEQESHFKEAPTADILLPVIDTRFRSVKHAVDSLALSIQRIKR